MKGRLNEKGGCNKNAYRIRIWEKIKLARRRPEVERQAEQILQIAGIDKPPVPEDVINCLRKVTVDYLDWGEISGTCEKLDDHWLIVLNKNESKRRQRFTLFHEMKHILDGRESVDCFEKGQSSIYQTLDEKIADVFASAILMPKSWIYTYWLRWRDIDRMAREFQVERKTMEQRLEQLGLVGSGPKALYGSFKIWLKKNWTELLKALPQLPGF